MARRSSIRVLRFYFFVGLFSVCSYSSRRSKLYLYDFHTIRIVCFLEGTMLSLHQSAERCSRAITFIKNFEALVRLWLSGGGTNCFKHLAVIYADAKVYEMFLRERERGREYCRDLQKDEQ